MTTYQFLSKKLQKFTLVEFAMVKWVYITLGVLIASLYTPLLAVSGWAFLVITLLAGLPLIVYTLGFKGGIKQKCRQYLQNNNPSNQVLTLISCSFLGIAAAAFCPVLASYEWWVYILIMLILVAKPFNHVFLRK